MNVSRFLSRALAVTVLAVTGFAPPTSAQEARTEVVQEFTLSVGDRIRVAVWPDSSLSGVFPIENTGVVHLPLLGARQAAGKTPAELREELRRAYEGERRLAVVSLTPEFRVSVLGEVRSPGLYWVEPGFGVFEILSLAGGLTRNANEDGIRVIGGGDRVFTVDAARLKDPTRSDTSLQLRSGDRLLVPVSRSIDWRVVLTGITLGVAVADLLIN